jgi:hypothetical protein
MRLESVRDLKLEIALEVFAPHLNDLIARSTLNPLDRLRLPALPVDAGIGIGIGIGQRPGEFSLAIRVRKRLRHLEALLQRILALARNEANIIETGEIRPFNGAPDPAQLQAVCRPLIIGCSVAHATFTAGTLGLIAQHVKTGRTVFVSNSHVFAHSGNAAVGDAITQPGKKDGGTTPVGALLDFAPLKTSGFNLVDAAIAVPDPAIALQPNQIPGIGAFTIPLTGILLPNTKVSKLGRTTGLTHGVITATEFDHCVVDSEIGNLTYDDQIEITGVDKPFSREGDSGSLVVTDQNEAIGMVFCGNEFANNDHGLTYANPLPKVMDALNLRPL